MKKALIGLALATTISTASAVDVGVGYSRDLNNDANGYGITVGQTWNKFSLTAGADRFDTVGGNHDQVSLVAGYQVLKVMGVALEAQFGAVYIQADGAKDGLTSVVGLGATLPLTKTLAVVGDVRRTVGLDTMKVHNGTTAGLGLRYSF